MTNAKGGEGAPTHARTHGAWLGMAFGFQFWAGEKDVVGSREDAMGWVEARGTCLTKEHPPAKKGRRRTANRGI